MNTKKIIELINAGITARAIEEMLDILKAYDSVCITRDGGAFDVSASIVINCYRHAEDYKVWFVRADEVYTEAERIENYAQAFADRPRGYDGKWDYKFVSENRSAIMAGYLKAHLVNGNIIWR